MNRFFPCALCLIMLTAASAAGASGGFVVDGDGTETGLKIGGRLQLRYTATASPETPGDAGAYGFSFRRLRVYFDYHIGDLHVITKLGSPDIDGLTLVEAYATKPLGDNWTISGGQIRLAFNREMWVSSKRQLAVDRTSIANNINTGRSDKVHAVEFKYQAEPVRVFFTLGEGMDSDGKNFNGPGSEWSVTIRGEVLLLGDNFKQFKQYTAPRGTKPGLLLGAAAHVQHTPDAGERFAWTADLGYQASGFNAMIMGGGHTAEDRNAAGEPESLFGVAGHIGIYATDNVEPFARYEWGTASSGPDLSVATVGVNWYIAGHALKMTVDAGVAFGGVGPAFNRNSDGLLESIDTRYLLRGQVQFLF